MEALDPIGRPRPASPADLSSLTFTGDTLRHPADLKSWLIKDQGLRIVHHTTTRLLTYALGRGLSPAEIQTAHRLADDCGGSQARFRDLLNALITSRIFSGEPPA